MVPPGSSSFISVKMRAAAQNRTKTSSLPCQDRINRGRTCRQTLRSVTAAPKIPYRRRVQIGIYEHSIVIIIYFLCKTVNIPSSYLVNSTVFRAKSSNHSMRRQGMFTQLFSCVPRRGCAILNCNTSEGKAEAE